MPLWYMRSIGYATKLAVGYKSITRRPINSRSSISKLFHCFRVDSLHLAWPSLTVAHSGEDDWAKSNMD